MSITLYRKYRPQCFADLTGQNHIKITLCNEITMGSVAHAYLFTGPRGTGKTTTARLLAKAVNCESRKENESEPCGACEACISITENRALDVIEIDAASHTGVDNVRENIIENARFTPSRLKNKVFIIDEVHMLSSSAWNALLKTIEEPPDRVILILATTEVAKVPATIISRCQRFDFHKISPESLVERLKKIAEAEHVEVEKDVLYAIARHADGGLRDAESMLGQIMALGEEKITIEVASIVLPYSAFSLVLDMVGILARRASGEALSFISALVEDGVELRAFLDELLEFSRKLLLTKFSGSLQEFAVGFDTAMAERILGYAKEFETKDLMRLLEVLVKSREAMPKAKITQLPLEMAVVDFCEGRGKSEPVFIAQPKHEAPSLHVPKEATAVKPVSKEIKQSEAKPEAVKEAEPIQTAPESLQNETVPQLALGGEKPAVTVNGQVTLERAMELWPEFVKRVQAQVLSLRIPLSVGRPIAVLDDILQIAVEHKINADKLNDVKSRLVLESVLAELFGVSLRVQGIIAKAPVSEDASGPDDMMKKALEAFGGRVVG